MALSVIAGYFTVTAVLNGVAWLGLFALVYSRPKGLERLAVILSPLRMASMLVGAAMFFRVGQLLHLRRREGGIWAIAALATHLVTPLLRHGAGVSRFGLITSLLGLGLIAVVWKELE